MPTIIDVVSRAGTFKTLASALQSAGLVDTLNGYGPFTVFAPTDEAFSKLPEGTMGLLLNDIPKLKNILLYHIVEGKMLAVDVANLTSVKTLLGQKIKIDANDKAELGRNESSTLYDSVHWHKYLRLNDSTYVIEPDLMANNGVIHVVNGVLFPK
jgi:uncharacterized surface protein with fasciclin (FAS1) repeats